MSSECLISFSQMPWKRSKKQLDNAGIDHLFGEAFSSVNGAPEGCSDGGAPEGHGDGGALEGHSDGGAPEGHGDGGTPEGHGDGGAPEGHGNGGAPEGEEWISQSMQDDNEMDELYSMRILLRRTIWVRRQVK